AGHREKLQLDFTKLFTLRTGLDFELYRSSYNAQFPAVPLDYRPFPGESAVRPNQTLGGVINELDYGFWTEGELRLPGRVKIFPGLRFDYFLLHGYTRTALDPRLII